MTTKITLAIIFCIITAICWGQTQKQTPQQKKQQRKERIDQILKEEEEGVLVYQKQNAFAIKLTTDGYSIFFEHGKYQSVKKTNLWWLELGERHSKREDRVSIPIFSDDISYSGNSFVAGKINNFYYFNVGIGQQLLIGQKGNKNGVAVSIIYGGGVSTGLLKPYYLSVINSGTKIQSDVKALTFYDSLYGNYGITGSPSFSKGFNEIKVVPGAHARTALRFDYGRYNELLSAVEVGVNASYYTQAMPIMFNIPGKKFFFNAYVAIAFGGRK